MKTISYVNHFFSLKVSVSNNQKMTKPFIIPFYSFTYWPSLNYILVSSITINNTYEQVHNIIIQNRSM